MVEQVLKGYAVLQAAHRLRPYFDRAGARRVDGELAWRGVEPDEFTTRPPRPAPPA